MKLDQIIKKRISDLKTLEENVPKMSLETQTIIYIVIGCLKLELEDLTFLKESIEN